MKRYTHPSATMYFEFGDAVGPEESDSGQWVRYEDAQAEIERYLAALKRIESFGHSGGHGRGFTCANIASAAIDAAIDAAMQETGEPL